MKTGFLVSYNGTQYVITSKTVLRKLKKYIDKKVEEVVVMTGHMDEIEFLRKVEVDHDNT